MRKIIVSATYLLRHPLRAAKIIHLYKHLHGRYRMTIVLAHSYREARYLKIYENRISSDCRNRRINHKKNHRPMIITLHDGLTHTGGLTDRLKGMCTLYSYAKNNGYVFKIYFTVPFNLEKYLQPNTYDWAIEDSSLCYDLHHTAVYTWEDIHSAHDFFHINKSKEQLHIGCNSGECSSSYSVLFHELFKPSEFLSKELNYHLERLGGQQKFISVSFRFQNLLGEFKEGTSTALSKEKQELLIQQCLEEVAKIYDKEVEARKMLVTSDSNIFREIAAETYPYVYTYTIPEEVGHIDYAEAGKSKELTAFVDMFLISCARKAYQIRSAEMYNSDFPNMAARINNVPYEIIEIS